MVRAAARRGADGLDDSRDFVGGFALGIADAAGERARASAISRRRFSTYSRLMGGTDDTPIDDYYSVFHDRDNIGAEPLI